jgi:hypothetical protein
VILAALVLLFAALVLLIIGSRALPAGTPARGADPPRTTGRAHARTAAGANALPDSVLAVIGRGRTVTLSDLVLARREAGPSTPPDTLTPQEARRFLERLVDREAVAEAALAEPRAWTAAESARFRVVRDRLMMGAALDSVLRATLAERRAAGDSLPEGDRETALERLGPALRDSSVRRLGATFDEPLLERLAAAWQALPRPSPDSSLAAQLRMLEALPRIRAADSAAVIARSSLGDYRVGDLLEAWRRLSPAYRPRIESVSELRDLVRNGLFERMLRRDAEQRSLDRRDDIAAALARESERIAVERYLEREVLERTRTDSLTLHRFFQEHREDWAIPMRVRVVRLAFDDRAAAERMAVQLRDPAEAESLEARALRLDLDLVAEVTAASDSALFAAALRAGTGAVIGPEHRDGSWRVARVMAVLPGRPARFDEVRAPVERRWFEQEGRRLFDELCARLRKGTRVTYNEPAIERWLADLPGATRR